MLSYKRSGSRLTKWAALQLPPGSGPRHIARHPGGNIIYILNELNATISVCSHDQGKLEIIQTVTALPKHITDKNTGAEIFCSQDGNFVFCSNRAHGSRHDCLASYQVSDGRLEQLEFIPTDRHPGNFCLAPSERFLLVANRDSDSVDVYTRDMETGKLERTTNELSVPRPTCVRPLEVS